MRGWDDGHMDNGWGFVMALGMLGVLVLLVALVVVAVVWATRSSHAAATPPPAGGAGGGGGGTAGARAILDERLARGEIEPDEYRARLEALTSGSPT